MGIGGKATKELHQLVQNEKEYVATVRLGMESETDDEEGGKTSVSDIPVGREAVDAAVKKFIGNIEQTPPVYSALKIKGVSAYARVRRGEDVVMKPRIIEIKSIDVISYAWPDIVLRVVTGPGVYIRALARDIGRALGTGAYLANLERTRVGQFTKEQCIIL